MASSSPSVARRLPDPPRKMLAAQLPLPAKDDRKPLAEAEARRLVGRVISRALDLAQMTKQEASHAMGYPDQSAISRWISAAERPHLDKLWAISPRMQRALVTAFAEMAGSVTVNTVITVEVAS